MIGVIVTPALDVFEACTQIIRAVPIARITIVIAGIEKSKEIGVVPYIPSFRLPTQEQRLLIPKIDLQSFDVIQYCTE